MTWYEQNKERHKALAKAWRLSNPDRMRELQRDWRQRNPERVATIARNSQLKHKFGLTPTDYSEILKVQGGGCAICRKPHSETAGKRLAVDHAHGVNQVRGLLCHDCNKGLGLFHDDVQVLVTAAIYLSLAEIVDVT